MGGFTATALVNRYVNDNRTWTHLTQVGTTNDLRRFLARNQYTADDKICRFQCILDVYIVGIQCLDSGAKNIIQIFQSVDVDIHDGNIRTHAHSNLARIGSDASAAKDDNFCFWRSWYTRKQYTGTTIQFLQIFCTFLHTQSAGNLAHRCKQRQIASVFQCFISNSGHSCCQHCIGQCTVCCQMQVGIDNLPFSEKWVFIGKRFFYLNDHICSCPDFLCAFQNNCTGFDIVLGHKTRTDSGVAFNIYLMSCIDITLYIIWGQTNTVLILFNFLNASDLHKFMPHFPRIRYLERPLQTMFQDFSPSTLCMIHSNFSIVDNFLSTIF